MRAREHGNKRPCELCKRPTMFQHEVVGARGAHVRWADACVACGEQTAKTAALPREKAAA